MFRPWPGEIRARPGARAAVAGACAPLARKGGQVSTTDDHDVQGSGHPAREELTRMYQWVQPRIAVPVHGEARHLAEHARLARACQVPHQIVGANGTLMRLAPAPAEITRTDQMLGPPTIWARWTR